MHYSPEPLRECHLARLSTCAPLPDFAALVARDPVQARGCGVREQETIIHNTGDEPILVEQADGSQMIRATGREATSAPV